MTHQQGTDEVSQGMDEAGSGQAPKPGKTTDRTKHVGPSTQKQDQLSEGMSKAGSGQSTTAEKLGGKRP